MILLGPPGEGGDQTLVPEKVHPGKGDEQAALLGDDAAPGDHLHRGRLIQAGKHVDVGHPARGDPSQMLIQPVIDGGVDRHHPVRLHRIASRLKGRLDQVIDEAVAQVSRRGAVGGHHQPVPGDAVLLQKAFQKGRQVGPEGTVAQGCHVPRRNDPTPLPGMIGS